MRTRAYTVTDADVEALEQAGLSEDEIFEATVTVGSTKGCAGWTRRARGSSEALRRRQRSRAGTGRAARRIREIRGQEPVGVVKTLLYRPEIFGRPFSNALDDVMRGPSDWTPGERELFAGFTSLLHQCPF